MNRTELYQAALFSKMWVMLGLWVWLLTVDPVWGANDFATTENESEAAFLVKFAKYTEWPATAFTNKAAPIVIGVLGTNHFGDSLSRDINGQTVNERSFAIEFITSEADLCGCHILFISHSEAAHMREILERIGTLPILTVGEDEEFSQNNGIIRFKLKDEKVRLEIDLAAARKAGVAISSRLLAVADVVKGKTKQP